MQFMDEYAQNSSESDLSEDESPSASPGRELLWACREGHIETVKRILRTNKEAVAATDKDGYTPLHRAAYSNHNTILKLLLQCSASVSARTVDGRTALHSACHWGNLECVRPLVRAHSDINAQTNSGQTPLHLAARNLNAARTLKYLLRQPLLRKDIPNSLGETAQDLAERHGPFAPLFDSVQQKPLTELKTPDNGEQSSEESESTVRSVCQWE
ncbi:Ankyrin repeat-containing domain [Trinorchestia longiramus]|nr:Ankyrin repeat-containing domain [Trinorchestia longiramus]